MQLQDIHDVLPLAIDAADDQLPQLGPAEPGLDDVAQRGAAVQVVAVPGHQLDAEGLQGGHGPQDLAEDAAPEHAPAPRRRVALPRPLVRRVHVDVQLDARQVRERPEQPRQVRRPVPEEPPVQRPRPEAADVALRFRVRRHERLEGPRPLRVQGVQVPATHDVVEGLGPLLADSTLVELWCVLNPCCLSTL